MVVLTLEAYYGFESRITLEFPPYKNPFATGLAEGIFAKIPSENPFSLPNFSQDLSDPSVRLFVKGFQVDLTLFYLRNFYLRSYIYERR